MSQRDLYAEVFMIAREQIEEEGQFSDTERSLGYEPIKGKIYELIEAGEKDPVTIATKALSWFRDRTQIDRSENRLGSQGTKS